ncbi:MAG TPA: ATP-binding protein [Streptosporangiaceae bacterium]|nr:ATP-binding protein [Streptosporangiaceae bacterium]
MPGPGPPLPEGGDRPELADVGRLARRLVRQVVHVARAEEASIQRRLADHLGSDAGSLPVASGSWPRYDQVNVQAGLDAWLAEPGREHEVAGLTGFRHRMFGLADLSQPTPWNTGLGLGSVTTDLLPSGPDGATLACVQCALYLVNDADGPVALMVRGPEEHMSPGVTVEAVAATASRAQRAVDDIRRLSIARNVFRGHVIEFGGEVFGYDGDALLSFQPRPHVAREQVVLPPDVLDGIERQVLGVARHAGRLLASGQHLKRGVLLHGAPGTGKTHTIRYLLGELSGVTVVLLSGRALGMIAQACSVARTLQPSVVVVEDVDLIAEQREYGEGEHPLLFQLLNEMDGLGEDLDITFLLTTNRADLLEPALAQRPGRVDHAARLPVPDAGARLRLLHLYQGKLVLDLADPDVVIARTEGVTASFMKELLRRAALRAADESGQEEAGTPIRVTDAHLATALDQLLDTRNELTQVLLGGRPRSGARQVLHEGGGDLAGLGDVDEVGAAPDDPEPGTAGA